MSEVTQTAAQETPTAAKAGASQAAVTPAPEAAKPAEAAKAPEAKAPETQGKPAAEAPKVEESKEKAAAEAPKPETETKPTTEEKPVVPEKYDLKLPADSVLNAEHLEKLSAYAKEKGLSNEQAQSLLERESKAVSDYAASQTEVLVKARDTWLEQASKDKEIGGDGFKQNSELAARVVRRFGTDDLRKELNKTGLGNHPELVRLLTRIGKSMAEDQLILPEGRPSGKKSTAEFFYGESANKEN